jgi:hypothetical protein
VANCWDTKKACEVVHSYGETALDWDRIATQMLREMIRQFLKTPGEFLTFGQLAFRIPSDKEISHLVADSRRDLFAISRDDRVIKLHTNVVRKILQDGIEAVVAMAVAEGGVVNRGRENRDHCEHFSQEELLVDLQRGALPSEALTRSCCWLGVCRIRGLSSPPISAESWREICVTRGYLLSRQNPRGF